MLDGAVLVVSAVEGVQAQTRVLMRTLTRLRIPTLIFINKTDRRGADPERVADELAGKLRIAAAPIDSAELAERLADHSDAFLTAYLDGGAPVREELVEQTRRALRVPRVPRLGDHGRGRGRARARHPRAAARGHCGGGPAAPCSRSSAAAGEKVAYVRGGSLQVRERVGESKVTAISVFEPGGPVRRDALGPARSARSGA